MEMTLSRRPAPHIRHTDSITVSMADVIISLIPCIVMGCYYYGMRLAINCIISVVTAMLTELAFSLFQRRRMTLTDLTAVVTGIIVTMLLPVNIPSYYLIIAATIAVTVAKAMFGGVGKNIFNPALCGVAVVTLVNTSAVTAVYAHGTRLPLFGAVAENITPANSILTQLHLNEEVTTGLLDAFVGRQPGVPATVCIPLIIVAGAYLIYRRIISANITLSMLVTVALLALLSPRVEGVTAISAAGYELVAGSLIFCAVFCANDPVTSPNTASGQILFGVFAGAITVLIRYYGGFEEGAVFAILIMNSTAFVLDKFVHKLRTHKRRGV